MAGNRLAVFTTVYPAVTRFLPEWIRSVAKQTDSAFDLWLGLDGLGAEDVAPMMNGLPSPQYWIAGRPGDSPAAVRSEAITRLVAQYDAVVFVDSDDLLAPDRIASARSALQRWDVAGCALRIMDEHARDLQLEFGPPPGTEIGTLLPRYNVFGLSNSAYRASILRHCLPIPSECVLVDWLLATRAWLQGARLGFDSGPRMWYRQYQANTAQVVGHYSAAGVLRATELVLGHYRLILSARPTGANGAWQDLIDAQARVRRFHHAITGSGDVLDEYVGRLNQEPREYVWWWCVAHPRLEALWSN